jgi:hypothetical protein
MGNDEPVIPFFPNSDYSYVISLPPCIMSFCLRVLVLIYYHSTGVSGVIGVLSALLRRADHGGSYVVSVCCYTLLYRP